MRFEQPRSRRSFEREELLRVERPTLLDPDRAYRNLGELLLHRPDLRRWVTDATVRGGYKGLGGLKEFLARHPHLIEDLQASRQASPDRATVLVVPDYPLLLTDRGDSVQAVVPITTCTLDAIADIRRNQQLRAREYGVVHADDKFETWLWEVAEQRESAVVLPYDSRKIDPEHYVALAAEVFENETFRTQFRKEDLLTG